MKQLFTIAFSVALLGSVSAQDLAPRPFSTHRLATPVGVVAKQGLADKSTTYTGYADYEEYESALAGNFQRFVDFSNLNFTDTGSMARSYVTFKDMILTPDYVSYNQVSWNAITQVRIDTVFFVFAHWNTTGTTNTIRVLLMDLDNDNRPVDNTVFFTDQVTTDTTMAGLPTATGFPIRSWAIPVGLNAPNKKFAMALEYEGAVADSFAVLFGYPHLGNMCSTFGIPAPVPASIGTYAYYRVTVGTAGVSQMFPTPAGGGYWYFDCNQNTNADWPDENPYQNFSMWAHLEVTENLNLGSLNGNSVNIYPNPTGEVATLKVNVSVPSAISYTVRDLAGRVVMASQFGEVQAGDFQETIHVGGLTSGVYVLTMNVGSESVSSKFVVK
jgi:hypothetical protein